MEIEDTKKIYEALYAKFEDGDTWTLPENISQNPRKQFLMFGENLLDQ